MIEPFRRHVRSERLCADPRRSEVHGERLVIGLDGRREDAERLREDTRIVHEDIDDAEAGEARLRHPLDLVRGPYVAREFERGPALRFDGVAVSSSSCRVRATTAT